MSKVKRAAKVAKDKAEKTKARHTGKKDEKNKGRRGGTSHLMR